MSNHTIIQVHEINKFIIKTQPQQACYHESNINTQIWYQLQHGSTQNHELLPIIIFTESISKP